VGNNKF